MGKPAEAATAYAEVYALGGNEDAEITQRYLDCLVKAGMHAEALKVTRDAIVQGRETPAVVDVFGSLLREGEWIGQGLEPALAEARATGLKNMQDKLVRSRVNKPSINFALKDLRGKQVELAGLKGKVVVIDFWATWCGPCKASFPSLQKIYNKYRGDGRVAIYAMNTWERVPPAERKPLVEKFMADNKYTFSVLYDESASWRSMVSRAFRRNS